MSEEKSVFIGKQAILDEYGEIEAYELLFRDGKKGYAEISDNKGATARVLSNALNHFGIDKLTNGAKAFINIDETILFSDFITTIPKDNFVLELLETTDVTPRLVRKVASLVEEGYIFAIDDYTGRNQQIFAPVMEYVSIVKLEMMDIPLDEVAKEVKDILEVHPNIKILAEKVEDRNTFEVCKKAGCTLFQGYFFTKPEIIKGKKIEPSAMAVLSLMNALNGDKDTSYIAREFDNNPKLTISLFKYINSLQVGLAYPVKTIKIAIALLGREALRNWVALLMFSGLSDEQFSEPIFDVALTRSKLMRELGTRLWGNNKPELIDEAALVGILSLMDAILSIPLEEVLKEVNVSDDIKRALLNNEGNLGRLLYFVKFLETINENAIGQIAGKLNIDINELYDLKARAMSSDS